MRRSLPLAFILVWGCSALVEIDDDKYIAGIGDGDDAHMGDGDGAGGGDGDGDGSGGAVGDGDGDQPSGGGGMGGVGAGGSGGNDTGGSGGTGTGGDPTGSGGALIAIPEPVHYYPLDGNTDDEGSEGPLPATVTGSVLWHPSTGLKGGSLELPFNAHTYISFDPLVAGASPFTISWWYIAAVDGYNALASRYTTEPNSIGWELIVDTSRPRVKIANQEIFYEADFPAASQGRWTHVAIGYEEMAEQGQDALHVWVNGEPVLAILDVFTPSTVTADGELRIGQGGNGTQPFSGILDELRVYDSLLTDEQVQALYLFDAPP